MGLAMNTTFPAHNTGHEAPAHAKKLSYIFARMRSGQRPNGLGIRKGKSALYAFFASVLIAPFAYFVVRIYFRVAKKEVLWVAAPAVITSVQNVLVGSKFCAVRKLVSNAIASQNTGSGSARLDASVACFENGPRKFMTSLISTRGIYFCKKPNRQRNSWAHSLFAFVGAAATFRPLIGRQIKGCAATSANSHSSIFFHIQ